MSAYLHVVVPPRLATGYRLAGARVLEAEDQRSAERAVSDLFEHAEGGVVAVYEPFFSEFPDRWRTRLDPLLVAIPAAARRDEVKTRRDRLAAMLREAIGYHFVFGENES
jgi:vacuolar-type H+-ATPase subunit F/Vma7